MKHHGYRITRLQVLDLIADCLTLANGTHRNCTFKPVLHPLLLSWQERMI